MNKEKFGKDLGITNHINRSTGIKRWKKVQQEKFKELKSHTSSDIA